MNRKIIVLYDTPMKDCDKMWVANELSRRGYKVRILQCPYSIFRLEKKGKVGKLSAMGLIFFQCIRAIFMSHKDDVLFCWNNWTGLIMNMLIGKKRFIISYNWLTPNVNPKTKWVYAKALQNPHLAAIINCKDNYARLLNDYQVSNIGNIYYIPDVYDDAIEFKIPEIHKEKRYCFMGGVENRDWQLFFAVAEQCPDINFVGVTSKSIKESYEQLPENVNMYFDLATEEYYRIMEESYLCICLLKEEKVSGLINIIKAAQLGKIMLITKTTATEIYYPEECKELLIIGKQIEDIKKKIGYAYNFDAEMYVEIAKKVQKFIQDDFSPVKAVDSLEKIINI